MNLLEAVWVYRRLPLVFSDYPQEVYWLREEQMYVARMFLPDFYLAFSEI